MATDEAEPQQRPPLTRKRVLRAAIELADEEGIDALSMRRLGRRLGVEAMSLYNHVANKDEILDGMLEVVVSEFEVPDPGSIWRAGLRRTAISTHRALLSHPWAAGLLVSRPGFPGPARMRYMDAILGSLRGAGFSAELTHHAYHVLDSHILGFTLWAVGFPYAPEDLERVGSEFLRELSDDRYPYLAEHVRGHLGSEFAEASTFEVGLDLVLDGLETLRRAGDVA